MAASHPDRKINGCFSRWYNLWNRMFVHKLNNTLGEISILTYWAHEALQQIGGCDIR